VRGTRIGSTLSLTNWVTTSAHKYRLCESHQRTERSWALPFRWSGTSGNGTAHSPILSAGIAVLFFVSQNARAPEEKKIKAFAMACRWYTETVLGWRLHPRTLDHLNECRRVVLIGTHFNMHHFGKGSVACAMQHFLLAAFSHAHNLRIHTLYHSPIPTRDLDWLGLLAVNRGRTVERVRRLFDAGRLTRLLWFPPIKNGTETFRSGIQQILLDSGASLAWLHWDCERRELVITKPLHPRDLRAWSPHRWPAFGRNLAAATAVALSDPGDKLQLVSRAREPDQSPQLIRVGPSHPHAHAVSALRAMTVHAALGLCAVVLALAVLLAVIRSPTRRGSHQQSPRGAAGVSPMWM